MRGPAVVPRRARHARRCGPAGERFDELVLDIVTAIDERWQDRLGLVEYAVEDTPQIPDDWGDETVPLSSLVRGTGPGPDPAGALPAPDRAPLRDRDRPRGDGAHRRRRADRRAARHRRRGRSTRATVRRLTRYDRPGRTSGDQAGAHRAASAAAPTAPRSLTSTRRPTSAPVRVERDQRQRRPRRAAAIRAAVAGLDSRRGARGRTTARRPRPRSAGRAPPGGVAPATHQALRAGRAGATAASLVDRRAGDREGQVAACRERTVAVTGPVAVSRERLDALGGTACADAAAGHLATDAGARTGSRRRRRARRSTLVADQLERDPDLVVAGVGQRRACASAGPVRQPETYDVGGGLGLRRAASRGRAGRGPTRSSTSSTLAAEPAAGRDDLAARGRPGLGRPRRGRADVERPPGTRDAAQGRDARRARCRPSTVTSATAGPLSGLTRVEDRGVLGAGADAGEPALGRGRLAAATADLAIAARVATRPAAEVGAAVDDDVRRRRRLRDGDADAGRRLGVVARPIRERDRRPRPVTVLRAGPRRRRAAAAGQTSVAAVEGRLVGGRVGGRAASAGRTSSERAPRSAAGAPPRAGVSGDGRLRRVAVRRPGAACPEARTGAGSGSSVAAPPRLSHGRGGAGRAPPGSPGPARPGAATAQPPRPGPSRPLASSGRSTCQARVLRSSALACVEPGGGVEHGGDIAVGGRAAARRTRCRASPSAVDDAGRRRDTSARTSAVKSASSSVSVRTSSSPSGDRRRRAGSCR